MQKKDLDINNEWDDFLQNGYEALLKIPNKDYEYKKLVNEREEIQQNSINQKEPSSLYISTRTQISFLSRKIDIYKMLSANVFHFNKNYLK